ncbi:KAP family NTPase [Desulfobacterota bacterium AH_259_B03_O07]|nr:KAP family NTPase [Desulfobacterota bacterium AH_259_B03_O07]
MKFAYIPDKEIDLYSHEDLLGTIPYVNTLVEIIKNCDTPFTIGLLGGWGTGKSSIIKTLENHFYKDEANKIKVFIYDAWKYSNDSFRRTFLLELKNFFSLESSEEFDNFYQDKQEEIISKIGLTKGWWKYLIFFLLPIIFINFKSFFLDKKFEYTTFIISLFFAALISFINSAYAQYKISLSRPRLFAPEQFEEIFREIINKLTLSKNGTFKWIGDLIGEGGSKANKIVIVIDNIDRCDQKIAIELLQTVKNFLEIENVIFVIPIDEESIKKFLIGPKKDANEFLRKLFNTSLRVKSFSDSELYDFATKLKNKYNLDLPNEVLSIICQEFSKNPRRIIQFLNTLQTEIVLVEMQEESNLLTKGSVTANLPVLTKLLIIKEEWPDLYYKLQDNHSLLKKINNAFRDDKYELDRDKKIQVLKDEDIKLDLDEDLYRFLMRTQQFEVDDVEPFFINKDMLEGIPDEVKKLVESQDWIQLKKLIVDRQITFDKLIDFISKKLDQDVIKRGLFKTSGFNILSLIFKIASDSDYLAELNKTYSSRTFDNIKSVLNVGQINDLITVFDPEDLCRGAKWLTSKGSNELVDRIINVINNAEIDKMYGVDSNIDAQDRLRNLILGFVDTFNDYPNYLERINDNFSKIIVNRPGDEELKNTILNSPHPKKLINEEILLTLNESIKQNFEEKKSKESIDLIIKLNEVEVLSSNFIENYLEIIIPYLNTNDWNHIKYWFEALKGFIQKADNENIINSFFTTLGQKYNFLFNSYTQNNKSDLNLSCYTGFIDLVKELYFATDSENDKDDQLVTWLNSFFERNEAPDVYRHVNGIYQEIIDFFNAYHWPFAQNTINRLNTISNWDHKKEIANTINSMLKKSDADNGLIEEEVNSVIDNYVDIMFSNEQYENAIKGWLSEVKENDFVKEIMIKNFESIEEISRLKKILDILSKIGDDDLLSHAIDTIILKTEDNRLAEIVNDLNKGFSLSEKHVGKLIDNKLKRLLASNEKEEQYYAIQVLEQLENIPKHDRNLLKTLLNDLESENFSDDEKVVLKRVIKKFNKKIQN